MTIDCELCLTVEDDKHLLVLVMKVVTHASAVRHHLTAMDEIEVHGHGVAGYQSHTGHIADTAVGPALPVFARVGMTDALGQRLCRHCGQEGREQERYSQSHDGFSHELGSMLSRGVTNDWCAPPVAMPGWGS